MTRNEAHLRITLAFFGFGAGATAFLATGFWVVSRLLDGYERKREQ